MEKRISSVLAEISAMNVRILLLLSLAAQGCQGDSHGQVSSTGTTSQAIIKPSGKTIESRFAPPSGYQRQAVDKLSFGYYLRTLPLKEHGAPVLYYNGAEKENNDIYSGVVAMNIGKANLQQCADAVMRLRAEYFYKTGQPKKIHFNFTNGFVAAYNPWMEGYRISVTGNKAIWERSGIPGNSYPTFLQYMDMVFTYAGTLSLSKELISVAYKDLSSGDVLIQGGSPGHAVIVVDVAENEAGKKVYLLAQSYMPAQETQILNNPMNKNISPWYELDPSQEVIETPQWKFTTNDLKRFED